MGQFCACHQERKDHVDAAQPGSVLPVGVAVPCVTGQAELTVVTEAVAAGEPCAVEPEAVAAAVPVRSVQELI